MCSNRHTRAADVSRKPKWKRKQWQRICNKVYPTTHFLLCKTRRNLPQIDRRRKSKFDMLVHRWCVHVQKRTEISPSRSRRGIHFPNFANHPWQRETSNFYRGISNQLENFRLNQSRCVNIWRKETENLNDREVHEWSQLEQTRIETKAWGK